MYSAPSSAGSAISQQPHSGRRQTLVAAATPADQQIVPAPDAEPETAPILATSVSGIEAACERRFSVPASIGMSLVG